MKEGSIGKNFVSFIAPWEMKLNPNIVGVSTVPFSGEEEFSIPKIGEGDRNSAAKVDWLLGDREVT